MKIVYIIMLIYLSITLVVYMFKSKKWEWLMGAMVVAPWILRILGMK